jgi:hypothetical protein
VLRRQWGRRSVTFEKRVARPRAWISFNITTHSREHHAAMTLDIQKINLKVSQNFDGILEYAAVFRNHPIYIQKIGFYVSTWVAAERKWHMLHTLLSQESRFNRKLPAAAFTSLASHKIHSMSVANDNRREQNSTREFGR